MLKKPGFWSNFVADETEQHTSIDSWDTKQGHIYRFAFQASQNKYVAQPVTHKNINRYSNKNRIITKTRRFSLLLRHSASRTCTNEDIL